MIFFKRDPKLIKNPRQNTNLNSRLMRLGGLSLDDVYMELSTTHIGLSPEIAEERLKQYGKNEIAQEKPLAWYWMLLNNFKNPFILVLLILGIVSYLTADLKGTLLVSIMIAISVLMRFMQEYRSSRAAEALRLMVRTKATVRRSMEGETSKKNKNKKEVPIEELVPGDVVYLSAGDMIPADVRLIRSKDLFISQSALTGESLPVEKFIKDPNEISAKDTKTPLEMSNLCFMGTSVVSGFAKAVVLATGSHTYFGSLADTMTGFRAETNFDKGITKVTWILIQFIVIMVPIIFLLNGFLKNNWEDSFLFAIAVAVGLTPEMLPMIVTANLAKGAVAMSRFKVIVKRLNSIQSFGAMDILCSDKTGTLTQDKIILEKYLDYQGEESKKVLEYGFLNSYYQSGLKNMLDKAILDHGQLEDQLNLEEDYQKIDEIPFDFIRKRLSVVVSREPQQHLLVCKGSVEEVLSVCSMVDYKGKLIVKGGEQIEAMLQLAKSLSYEGFRVIAVAYKILPLTNKSYTLKDENELIFIGLMAFLDPPKESAAEAIKILYDNGVKVKILTGDNDIVTKRVCREVNLPLDNILLGSEIETLSNEELAEKVEVATIFAKLAPLQKARIIQCLQKNDHVVGFLGDGINDAPALREADVGISVDTATDIARESADIILLEKNLLVLGEGVIKGRGVYGNIIKYIKMTTSSNFGNVFSMLIASAFLPFLPMLPLQILIQNLLYDFSQLTIPWDQMDKEFLRKPRTWDPKGIARFMVAIGPISSVFDVTTFALLWYFYEANSATEHAFFQSGWFVEGLLSQTLIVHMIRTKKIPFIQSVATMPVVLMTVLIMCLGLYLPFSLLGPAIGLVPLPASYFGFLLITLLSYCVLTQLVKVWYIKKFKAWL